MTTLFSRKRGSSLALAIALATGAAIAATAVIPAEASAQRNRDRDRNQEQEQNDGGGYSEAFRAAYVPLDEAVKVEGADVSALRPQLQALIPLLNTNDEKFAGGLLLYNASIKLNDPAMRLQGMESMLSSSSAPAESRGQFNFIAYQLAANAGDFAKARRYLQGAIDNNFTTEQVDRAALQISMFENYVSAGEYNAGFDYFNSSIASRKAEGLGVDEQWYRRGISVAYQNEVVPEVYDILSMWISDYPSDFSWRESINVTRNLNTFGNPELLDLFRLSRKVGVLSEASDYDYYVEAADPRRLPKEVKDVIEEGIASGVVNTGNLFISESLDTANSRIASDRADLPALERDANAADAGLRTVTAAGGAFLSYGEYAKAASFYERALNMPGVDTNEALTRLGIAQAGTGDYAAAKATFERVTGNRAPIANLWIAYAEQQMGGSAPVTATAAAETEATVSE